MAPEAMADLSVAPVAPRPPRGLKEYLPKHVPSKPWRLSKVRNIPFAGSQTRQIVRLGRRGVAQVAPSHSRVQPYDGDAGGRRGPTQGGERGAGDTVVRLDPGV